MEKRFTNSQFIDLIRDDEFVRLIKNADNPDRALADLICKYPDNQKNIEYACAFVRYTSSDRKALKTAYFNEMLKNIEHRLGEDKTRKQKVHSFRWLKAASVLFAFIALASVLVYYQLTNNPLKQFAEENTGSGSQSLIILSDGSNHVLSANDSKIDYQTSQGEVIIKKNEKDEEKVRNSSASGPAVLNQVIVPYGQQQRVVLSDGTCVRLNAGSKLVFPVAFTGNSREVYLIGEGFFEVHKDARHPFIVKTDFVDVNVLGTTFNISAYKDERVASAVLVEGSVNISQKNKVFGNKSFILSPGQACFYSVSDEKAEIKTVDVSLYTSWKDGIYRFRDIAVADVIQKIIKYYNVPVQLEKQELAATKISGKLIIANEISEVLHSLSRTLEGRYEKNENGIYLIKTN